MSEHRLDREKLDAYQEAIKLVGIVKNMTDRLPRGHADLKDQLERASSAESSPCSSVSALGWGFTALSEG